MGELKDFSSKTGTGSGRWRKAVFLCSLSLALAFTGCIATRPRLRALPTTAPDRPAPVIVIGFVGFIDRPDDLRLSVVKLAERLRESYSSDVYVEVFENRKKEKARQTIWQLLDTNHDGILSSAERNRAQIILYGHSWGGSTVVSLSRQLQKDEIPVRLTVQVDSVHKLGQNDARIPANVLEAANFYQPHGFFHGRRRIFAADPAATKILGNYRFEYEKHSVRCPSSFSWYEMYFARAHIQMDCDPKAWSRVESLIRQHLPQADDNGDDQDKP